MSTHLIEKKTGSRELKPIVLVDKHQPQFFDFDKAIIFDEKQFEKKIAIELVDENDNITQAETSILYVEKIRFTCSKDTPIIESQSLTLNFKGLFEKLSQEHLLKIPCTIDKVENYKHITHATLVFNPQPDSEFSSWYSDWIKKNKPSNKREEISKNAYNFIYQYYKRLYCDHLLSPVLFSDTQQVKHAFTSKPGLENISFTNEQGINISIPNAIFQPYIKNPQTMSRMPLFIWIEKNRIFYFSTLDYPKISPRKLISWLKHKEQWRILLVRNNQTSPVDELQQQIEVNQFFTDNNIDNQAEFVDSFQSLSITTHILDISSLFTELDLPEYKVSFSGKEINYGQKIADYHQLSFKIKRTEPRYNYSTSVTISPVDNSEDLLIAATSIDISFLGLRLMVSSECPFMEHDLVFVDFIQWNEMLPKGGFFKKKKEEFEAVDYQITHIEQQGESFILSLAREKRESDPKINSFIKNKIDEIKKTIQGSLENTVDLYKSLTSSLWINNNISGLTFFLGRDKKGIRIIQAIANTQGNQKIQRPYLKNNDWSFLQKHALAIGIELNNINTDVSKTSKKLNIGIYCFFDDISNTPGWKSQTDLDFITPQHKADFIATAVKHKTHFFYHCSMVAIKTGKDEMLNDESSAFVSLGANRLKEIHGICRSLIAVGELNDVTPLIKFIYKSN